MGELWEYDQDGSPILKEGKTLVLSSEELQMNPIYSFFTLGQSNLYNEAKLKFNRLLPEGERDWIIEAQDTVIFRHTKDATVFANVNTDANTNENDTYMQAQEVFQAAVVSMITAADEAQVRALYADAKAEIESMGIADVLAALQVKFDANRAILG